MPAKPIGFNRHALIALREGHHLTRDEVATRAECNPAFYGRLEKGDRGPSLDVAVRLAAVFRCDVRALVPSYTETDAEAAA